LGPGAVRARAAGVSYYGIKEFSQGITAGSQPSFITPGPDGNLWFTEYNANKIGRMSPTGSVREFTIPTSNGGPAGITAGPDGNLWFTELSSNGNRIGQVTPSGTISEFPLPAGSRGPLGITAGPDGALWFTESGTSQIGRIDPTTHAFSEFTVP